MIKQIKQKTREERTRFGVNLAASHLGNSTKQSWLQIGLLPEHLFFSLFSRKGRPDVDLVKTLQPINQFFSPFCFFSLGVIASSAPYQKSVEAFKKLLPPPQKDRSVSVNGGRGRKRLEGNSEWPFQAVYMCKAGLTPSYSDASTLGSNACRAEVPSLRLLPKAPKPPLAPTELAISITTQIRAFTSIIARRQKGRDGFAFSNGAYL